MPIRASLNAALPFPVAGRTAPAPSPVAHLPRTAPGRRPPELDDANRLRALLRDHGTTAIAEMLGVSRKAVRLACDRLGIPAHPEGRRRGRSLAVAPPAPSEPTGSITVTGTAGLILERFQRESRAGGPAPSTELLAARIRACVEAERAGDQLAYEDALLAIASAAGLVHQHQRRIRRAA